MDIMSKNKGITSLIAAQVISFIIGLVFIVFHSKMISWVGYIVGVALIVVGIMDIIKYFSYRKKQIYTYKFTSGALTFLFGIYLMLNMDFMLSMLAVFFGFYIMIHGVLGAQFSIDAIVSKVGEWKITMAMSIVNIILALVILMYPFETTEVLIMYIGIFMVISSVVNIVSYILNNQKIPR